MFRAPEPCRCGPGRRPSVAAMTYPEPTLELPVEALHVRAFARAIGDPAAETAAEVAPPTFVVAAAHTDPEHPLRPRPGERWYGSGRHATGYGPDDVDPAAGVLYAEQHFDLERAVRVGEVLTLSVRPGRTWEKEGRRGGRLAFFEEVTEYRGADGELVVTGTLVGVRTARRPGEGS